MSDKTICPVANDEQAWFETLYHDFFPKVYAFVRKHTATLDEAEDLVHDVFLKLWQHRTSFSRTIPPDAQLLTIARQLVINRYKREAVRQRVYTDWQQNRPDATPYDEAEQPLQTRELAQKLQDALATMPPKRRAIFEKSRFEGLSYDEIADQLAISRSTVESQMVKALRLMRERLALLLLFPFL